MTSQLKEFVRGQLHVAVDGDRGRADDLGAAAGAVAALLGHGDVVGMGKGHNLLEQVGSVDGVLRIKLVAEKRGKGAREGQDEVLWAGESSWAAPQGEDAWRHQPFSCRYWARDAPSSWTCAGGRPGRDEKGDVAASAYWLLLIDEGSFLHRVTTRHEQKSDDAPG